MQLPSATIDQERQRKPCPPFAGRVAKPKESSPETLPSGSEMPALRWPGGGAKPLYSMPKSAAARPVRERPGGIRRQRDRVVNKGDFAGIDRAASSINVWGPQ